MDGFIPDAACEFADRFDPIVVADLEALKYGGTFGEIAPPTGEAAKIREVRTNRPWVFGVRAARVDRGVHLGRNGGGRFVARKDVRRIGKAIQMRTSHAMCSDAGMSDPSDIA